MRFSDFFTRYKRGLKEIDNKISLGRRIVIMIPFLFWAASVLMFEFNLINWVIICVLIGIIWFIILSVIDSKKSNLDENYYNKRIAMLIDLLKKYNIDIYNSNSINLLIEEAQKEKQNGYLTPLIGAFKKLAITIPIIGYILQAILAKATQYELIIITLDAIFVILVILLLILFIKSVESDIYKKYDELIYDLRQIRIFYSKEDTTSSD